MLFAAVMTLKYARSLSCKRWKLCITTQAHFGEREGAVKPGAVTLLGGNAGHILKGATVTKVHKNVLT